jgi:hypothetical protein
MSEMDTPLPDYLLPLGKNKAIELFIIENTIYFKLGSLIKKSGR